MNKRHGNGLFPLCACLISKPGPCLPLSSSIVPSPPQPRRLVFPRPRCRRRYPVLKAASAQHCSTAHPVDFRSPRSEEHTSELQSLMRISSAVFCLKKQNKHNKNKH